MSFSNLELLFNYSSCLSFCQVIPSFLFYIFLHSSRMNTRQLFFSYISCQLNLSLTILSPQHTLYLTCQLNYPTQKQWICFRTVQQTKNPGAGTIFPNCPNSRKSLVFCIFPLFYFSTRDINTTHSTCPV